MPRLRLGFLKHPFLAVAALVGLVSTVEVGLGIREIYRPPCESHTGLCPLGLRETRLLEPPTLAAAAAVGRVHMQALEALGSS